MLASDPEPRIAYYTVFLWGYLCGLEAKSYPTVTTVTSVTLGIAGTAMNPSCPQIRYNSYDLLAKIVEYALNAGSSYSQYDRKAHMRGIALLSGRLRCAEKLFMS
ncbi:MAG TPA: hypothetical protein VHU84_18220 [Lacipirellulaceae bacterium]|jgi:hypothetical protein|nr:hypothetical protein [Lacipirellulaceae bacterium]